MFEGGWTRIPRQETQMTRISFFLPDEDKSKLIVSIDTEGTVMSYSSHVKMPRKDVLHLYKQLPNIIESMTEEPCTTQT